MQTLYSRSVRQQDAIHTLKKCFVIKNPNLCQRVGRNFTRRAHVGVKRCNVTPAIHSAGQFKVHTQANIYLYTAVSDGYLNALLVLKLKPRVVTTGADTNPRNAAVG